MGKIVFKLACAVLGTAALSSCTDYTIMDEEAIRNGLFGDEYSENFAKVYGKVKSDQTWDLSLDGLRRRGLMGGPSYYNVGNNAATRAADNCNGAIFGATAGTDIVKNPSETNYYSVETNTMAWLNAKLTEGELHTSLGHPFKLVKPEDNHDFLIIPFYQGHSGMSWDLHLVAKNPEGALKDYMIWSKSDNIRYTRDLTKAGGEEYFYGAEYGQRDYDGDGSEEKRGYLKLGAAYSEYFDKIYDADGNINLTKFIVYITVPAGGKFEGQFGDVYTNISNDSDLEYYKISCDNTTDNTTESWVDPSTPTTWTFNLLASNKSWSVMPSSSSDAGGYYWKNGTDSNGNNNLFNFGIKRIVCNDKCCVDTYAESRVHISVEMAGEEGIAAKTIDLDGKTGFTDGHTMNRAGIQAKPIRIDCSKIKNDEDFFLYLDVTYGQGQYNLANTGTKQRSDEGMMLALTEEQINGNKLISSSSALGSALSGFLSDESGDNWEYFVVGAEDANLSGSDWDINDVVFLIAGRKAPKIKEIISKRYMIEDLGSTYDFDFNDIVVDVTQEQLKNVSDGTISNVKQTANLAHLCGTIPFQLTIGSTELGKVSGNNANSDKGGDGYTPGKGKDSGYYDNYINVPVENWNPATNNIQIRVWKNEGGSEYKDYSGTSTEGHTYTNPNDEGVVYTFPTDGCDKPYIIAVDQSVGWTKENVAVPVSWFTNWPLDFKWDHQNENDLTGGIGGSEQNVLAITWNTVYNYILHDYDFEKYCTMNADVMAEIEVGDEIDIYFSGKKDGAEAKIQMGNTINNLEFPDKSDHFQLYVNADNINKLKAGIAIMGKGYTVDRVRLKKIKQLDWGNVGTNGFAMSSNEWFYYCFMNKDKLTNIAVGDEITVTIEAKDNAYAEFQSDWKKLEGFSSLTSSSKSITLKVTDENIASIQANGIAIQGHDFTVKKVQLIRKIEQLNNETNFVMNSNYNNYCYIPASALEGATLGDKIRVNMKDVTSGGGCDIQSRSDWKTIQKTGLAESQNNFTITIDSQTKLDKVKAAGIAIQGSGFTVVSVELIAGNLPNYSLSLDNLEAGWDSTYDSGNHLITFTKQWTGRGWALNMDRSAYSYLVVDIEYPEDETAFGTQLVVKYAAKDENGDNILTATGFNIETNKSVALDDRYSSNIVEAYIQGGREGGKVKVNNAYFVAKQ